MQNSFLLPQNICYENVSSQLKDALNFFAKQPAINIDGSKLKNCDSSISAFFIELLRYAKQKNKTFTVAYLPEQAKKILQLSDLNQFIENR